MKSERAPRPALTALSVIWLVPILALAVTLAIAWKSYADRGVLIDVEFADATGIKPGETALKFREIDVGKVETVKFTSDLQRVVVGIRVNNEVAQFIDTEAKFWLVRPEVSAQGISRLDTVLSGAFIEGFWDAKPGEAATRFVGLDRAPIAPDPTKGTWVVLSTTQSSGITNGAPVMFRGLKVGKMSNLRLSDRDETVLVDAFIEAPHDQRLTTGTVFWDTSGFSVSLGARGLSVDVRSLSSLVQGGIEFDTLTSGGEPVEQGHRFTLYEDEDAARNSLFATPLSDDLRVTVLLDEPVRGLMVDAPVHMDAQDVGRVTELGVQVTPADQSGPRARQKIVLALSGQAMGLSPEATPDQILAYLGDRVAEGLRAKVTSTGLLATTMIVDLVRVEGAAPASIEDAQPYPILPSVAGENTDLAQSAQGVFNRISSLPLEETLRSATDMMNSVTALARSEDTRAIPKRLADTLAKADSTMADIGAVAQDLREAETGAKLGQMVEDAGKAMTAVEEAAKGVPDMVASIDAVAKNAQGIPLAEIGTQAEGILADLRAMLGSDDAERLPKALSTTLDEAALLLSDLRTGGAGQNLNQALASASAAADSVRDAANRLPQLAARLEETLANADRTVTAYGNRSDFNREVQSAMRELSRAAQSFGSLARTIERNPRAFILGR
ncbi:intermembrane transport protein PqiB [Paracoccus sp. p3-h83]|uniref:PqiB family protein n=1 Tax=Paracoccus sp. p3-h83 TaxID=3342805 RepID=UPI0035BB1364